MSWEQAPAPRSRRKRPVPMVVPWLVAVLPLRHQQIAVGYPSSHVVTIAVVAAVWLLVLRLLPKWPVLVAATVAGSIALVPEFGTGLAANVSLLLFVPLTMLVLALPCLEMDPLRHPLGSRLPTGRQLRIALLPLGPAAVGLWRFQAFRFAVVCMVATCLLAVVAVARPAAAERFALLTDRLMLGVDRAGAALGRAVSVVMMLPALVLATVVWAVQRFLALDPLRTPVPADGGWVRRTGQDPEPARLFSGSTRTPYPRRRRTAFQRVRLVLAGVVVCAIATSLVTGNLIFDGGVQRLVVTPARCTPPPSADPVYGDDPAWPGIVCEVMDFADHGRFDAVSTYIMQDHESENVHVTDGVRKTWRAPACDCRRITMWMFGGSAAFGWWQRDDHTVASELAKAAWADGIALDIDLIAMPGWVAGQGIRKFGDLASKQDPPDFALFYDGGNDLARQMQRNNLGRGADESETSYTEEDLDKLLREGPYPWTGHPVDDGDPVPGVTRLPPDKVAGHAMDRYLANIAQARWLTKGAGTEPIFVWQPLQPAAPVVATPKKSRDPGFRKEWREMLDVALPRLPDDAIDLSGVFDDVEEPIFNDIWHTNELGSDMAAAELYRQIEPRLVEAAG